MAKHILSCSFGKDSIATALLALQHGEPLDELVYCEVMFSEEISGELPEHNRFIHETAIRKDLSILLLPCCHTRKNQGDAFGIPSEWALYNSAGLQAAADQGISEGIAPGHGAVHRHRRR